MSFGMLFLPFATPLTPARLVQRRDRFLADVVLDSGQPDVAYCVNPGRASTHPFVALEPVFDACFGGNVWYFHVCSL